MATIALEATRADAFSEADERLLSTLASSMGVALENARLFDETKRLLEETEQRNAELAIINSVQQGLAEKLDMQAMYDLVGDKIQEIFDAQVVDIGIVDRSAGCDPASRTRSSVACACTGRADRPSAAYRRLVLETREPLRRQSDVERVAGRRLGTAADHGRRALAKSLLFVPLIVGDEALGVVSLQNLDREDAFTSPTCGC